MWNVLSATKRGITQTSVTNLKQKMENRRKIDDSGPKQESEVKSVRQIRIRFPELEDNRADPFMRHWTILSNLGRIGFG